MKIVTENSREGVMKLVVLSCALVLTLTSSVPVRSQQNQTPKPSSADPDKASSRDDDRSITGIEEEMRAKRAIKLAEKEYQENVDRARDLSNLGVAIVGSFKQKNILDQEDFKKLEKFEKLARKIRGAAGGSEDDTEMEKPPANVGAAVAMLGDLSQSLKEKVEKTPKHVISAAVIDQANVLLELVRIVRALSPKV